MSLNTFSPGVNTSFSSELNENFRMGYLLAIDTTATTNVNSSGDGGSDSSSTTVTVDGSKLTNIDYLVITVDGLFYCEGLFDGSFGGSGSIDMTVTDTISSTDIHPDSNVLYGGGGRGVVARNTIHSISFWHTVTAGNRSNGMSIDLIFDASTSGDGGSRQARFTNRAITVVGFSSPV